MEVLFLSPKWAKQFLCPIFTQGLHFLLGCNYILKPTSVSKFNFLYHLEIFVTF